MIEADPVQILLKVSSKRSNFSILLDYVTRILLGFSMVRSILEAFSPDYVQAHIYVLVKKF